MSDQDAPFTVADLERYSDFIDLDTGANVLRVHTHQLVTHLGVPNDRPGRVHACKPIADAARKLGWAVELVGVDEEPEA